METARLAFGKADASSEVRGGSASPDDPKRYEPLRRLLSREVPKKENRLIASHGNPFRAVAGGRHAGLGTPGRRAPRRRLSWRAISRASSRPLSLRLRCVEQSSYERMPRSFWLKSVEVWRR